MLIVVMMGKWSDDSACWVVHDVRLYSVLDTVVISGEDVCCSVVFGTLVGVFSVMWSELLMASAISCPVWSSVYECHKVECAFTFTFSGSSQCCILHDLQFVNAGRGCNRRPYRRGILLSRSHNCFIGSLECLILFTPSCCSECFYDL